MDSSAVLKIARIRSTNAQTANSVNGVLICAVAAVLIRGDTPERTTKSSRIPVSKSRATTATRLGRRWRSGATERNLPAAEKGA